MLDLAPTLLSQYAQSPAILTLLTTLQAAIDPGAGIDSFVEDMWDVSTATGYGLEVWGRIVGIGRVLQVASGDYLGMEGPTGASGEPFNQAPFYNGAPLTSNYALSDDAFRKLILAKAAANICDGSIPAVNAILIALFGDEGHAWVQDNGDMTVTYRFDFALSAVDFAIVQAFVPFLTATGVAATIVDA